MEKFKLHSGDEMPLFGLGTWKSPENMVYDAIREAIRLGYRHIDCARIYGNEAVIGRALNDAFSEGDVERKEMWITSKLWNTHHDPDDAQEAIQTTLNDLQLNYLDLYLIHWPVLLKKEKPQEGESHFLPISSIPLTTTWKKMQDIRNQGLTRNIGVSNFNTKVLNEIIDATGEIPSVNQVESQPYLQHNLLKKYCDNKGILITAYCPLGNGNKSEKEGFENTPHLFLDPTLNAIAENHDATPAQIMIRWAVQRGTSVIPKSTNAGRLAENLNAMNIQLSDQEMKDISGLEKGFRYINGDVWCKGNSPYTLEQLWGEY